MGIGRISVARKRSLGQGNVFTPVCHSVHGGCLPLGAGVTPLNTPPGHTPLDNPRTHTHPGHIPPGEMAIEAGGTHPTGMHSCYNCNCDYLYHGLNEW